MCPAVQVGIIGSGFVADIHADAFQRFVPNAEVVAVASPTPGKAARFASKHSIPNAFESYRDLLAMPDIDLITLALPNDLHCQVTLDAARAGKHIVCEKPLCRTLEEADQMIDACRQQGVLLLYAEELLFAPKYVRARQLVEEGALGRAFLVKQWEEHFGPHEPWFWDVNRSGGGVMLDMGCHSIEYARWVFGKRARQERVRHAGNLRPQGQNGGRGSRHRGYRVRGRLHGAGGELAGPNPAAWTTDAKSTVPKATRAPICCAATPSSPTAMSGTATPPKRWMSRPAGRSPCLKRRGTTAFRRRCSISSTAYRAR